MGYLVPRMDMKPKLSTMNAKMLKMKQGGRWGDSLIILCGLLSCCGCSCMNGDPLWLSENQKNVSLRDVIYSGSVEYSLGNDNFPFVFQLQQGTYEFGIKGCIDDTAIMRFEIGCGKGVPGFEFHLSNGMLRLVRGGEEESWGEIRHSPMAEDVQYSLDKVRAGLDARGKTLRICCFPPTGFSLHLHKTGSYGTAIVVRYREMLKDRNWLVVEELKNAHFFRYPWL